MKEIQPSQSIIGIVDAKTKRSGTSSKKTCSTGGNAGGTPLALEAFWFTCASLVPGVSLESRSGIRRRILNQVKKLFRILING